MFLLKLRRPEKYKEQQDDPAEMTVRELLAEIDGSTRGLPSEREAARAWDK